MHRSLEVDLQHWRHLVKIERQVFVVVPVVFAVVVMLRQLVELRIR